MTLAGRVRLGTLVGADAADIPADLRFYSGGGGSVRGFDYQSLSPMASDGSPFGGLSVAEIGAELRWRANPRWGGVMFVDVGAASENTIPETGDLHAAAGVGLRYHLGFAPVRLDIATPIDRRPGEARVQFYFSIGQAF